MSFWEVSVDHGLIAQERSESNVVFHSSLDASFSMAAMERHTVIRSLLLFAMLAVLMLASFLTREIEPAEARLCFFFAAIFGCILVVDQLARLFSVPLIERAWLRQFAAWYEESGIGDAFSPDLDLEYLRAHDPRLDVVMARLNLGERVTSGSWVQKTAASYPNIRDVRFFVRFWIRRSEAGFLAFMLAGVLFVCGLSLAGTVLAGAVAFVAFVLIILQMRAWNSSANDTMRYLKLFHPPDEILGPDELMLGMVSQRTLRQLRMALKCGSAESVRYWVRRFLQEMLQAVDPYRYPDVLADIVEPRLEQWYGKPLGVVAKDEIANFGKE